MKHVYFTRDASMAGTAQDLEDFNLLNWLGLCVFLSEDYKNDLNKKVEMLNQCSAIVFRALPDGSIPYDVAVDLVQAEYAEKLPIIQLPNKIGVLAWTTIPPWMKPKPEVASLSVEDFGDAGEAAAHHTQSMQHEELS